MAEDKGPSELDKAFRNGRVYFAAVAAFSLAVNILYLASPLYMLQVYNRVVSSGSTITLILLTVILVVALAALSGLDVIRGWILSRFGVHLEDQVADRILKASLKQPTLAASSQPLRDFEQVKQFFSGGPIFALFDFPWVPIYIVVAFMIHPWLGWFTLGCCVLLIVLALLNEWQLAKPLRESNAALSRSLTFADMSVRSADAIQAMGMVEAVLRRWSRDRNLKTRTQAQSSTLMAGSTGLVKFLRLAMQSLVLGLGAYLAIERQVSVGAMFASSFLLGRALQPLEQLVSTWRQVVASRTAFLRLRELLVAESEHQPLSLPKPTGQITLENVHYAPPGTSKLALRAISFRLAAGETLGVVGPSGAGKSTLMRILVGVLKPSAGTMRLDGADLATWPRGHVGRYLGYLPQDVALFSDTVAANIGRFQQGMDEEIIAAAQMAGVHDMILRLPQGYETQIGEGGAVLSGGYRQRIGLARAIFGRPSLVVLDEPSSNLDGDGDAALTECLSQLKAAGATVVIVSHRPVTLATADKVLLLKDGAMEAFGPRDEVVARIAPKRPGQPAPVGASLNG